MKYVFIFLLIIANIVLLKGPSQKEFEAINFLLFFIIGWYLADFIKFLAIKKYQIEEKHKKETNDETEE